MGASYQANTSTLSVTCTKDADCYAASTIASVSAATTTAEKAKRCCMYLGMTTIPSGTSSEMSNGDLDANIMNLYFGMPLSTGYYTTICNMDYPTTIPLKGNVFGSTTTWDASTNIQTYGSTAGSW